LTKEQLVELKKQITEDQDKILFDLEKDDDINIDDNEDEFDATNEEVKEI